MCVGFSVSAATKVLNRFFTHVHSLFETGITSRLILLEDSVKVNLEVQDKVRHRDIRAMCPELPARLSLFPLCPSVRKQVEVIRQLSEVRLDEAQEHALERALARLGELWCVRGAGVKGTSPPGSSLPRRRAIDRACFLSFFSASCPRTRSSRTRSTSTLRCSPASWPCWSTSPRPRSMSPSLTTTRVRSFTGIPHPFTAACLCKHRVPEV